MAFSDRPDFRNGAQIEWRSLGERIPKHAGNFLPHVSQRQRFSWFILRSSYLRYRSQAGSQPRGRARTDPLRHRIQQRGEGEFRSLRLIAALEMRKLPKLLFLIRLTNINAVADAQFNQTTGVKTNRQILFK